MGVLGIFVILGGGYLYLQTKQSALTSENFSNTAQGVWQPDNGAGASSATVEITKDGFYIEHTPGESDTKFTMSVFTNKNLDQAFPREFISKNEDELYLKLERAPYPPQYYYVEAITADRLTLMPLGGTELTFKKKI